MSKRKSAFSFDDLDDQMLKATSKETLKQSPKKKIKAADSTQKSTTTAKSANKSRSNRFEKDNSNLKEEHVVNEMTSLNSFDALHTLSNKRSTPHLAKQSQEETSSLLMHELSLLQKKEKEANNNNGGQQKYKKKMDPEKGRFSRYDTEETALETQKYFLQEEERLNFHGVPSAFTEYEQDNAFFKVLEKEESERNNKYRDSARDNVSSLEKSLGFSFFSIEGSETTGKQEEEEINASHPHQEYFEQKNSNFIPEEIGVLYCASFLREAKFKYERNCKKEENCVAKKMSLRHPDTVEDTMGARGWICREFLLPSQQKKLDSERVLPLYRQLCLLCNRLLTTFTYKKNEDENKEPLEIIQDHCNVIGVENDGYPLETCLEPIASKSQKIGFKITGITRPIRRFSAVDYVPKVEEILDQDNPGQLIKVRCFAETPLNFHIAPVVAIKIQPQSMPYIALTEVPSLE
jgi:hypothetical protein